MSNEILDDHINVRINSELKRKFFMKSSKMVRPTQILRELIEAYVNDQIKIEPMKISTKE